MFRTALVAIIGLTALATATVIAVSAAAFAIFIALTPSLGPAGAAAIVAVSFALTILLCAAIITNLSARKAAPDPDGGLIEHLFNIARERPLVAVAAAIAAGVLAIRRPALVATVLAAFLPTSRSDK